MSFKPIAIPRSKDPEPIDWRLTAIDGGVVYTDLPQRMLDNQSDEMLNLYFKERILTKRPGQTYLTENTNDFFILSIYEKIYKGYMIFASGTKLCKCILGTGAVTTIYTGLTANKGSFFVFKNNAGEDILYYKNGAQYVQYDGATASLVVGYIPTVVTGRAPTGGGTPFESYNRIQPAFKNSFSATGAATVYQLTLTNLDATPVTATLNGVAKVETTDFTVNRVTGQVTFLVAPTIGTDNLIIKAYKTDAAAIASILSTKYAVTFGGDNDTRVFVAGDSTTYYYSGLLDPTYFPENQYNNAGVDNSFITGFGKQYNVLVVFKERSMYAITYDFNSGVPRFPLALLNDSIGCDMPNTIQLIKDNLVWCNTYNGVTILNSTLLKDEKNVSPLSENINGVNNAPGLLQESNLSQASSVDFDGHYWICVNEKVWAWNYEVSPYINTGNVYEDQRRLAWFVFDNISANCWFYFNNELYYGHRYYSRIVKMIPNVYNDFGVAINAYWASKLNDFGLFDWTKTILQVRFSTKTDVATKVTTEYLSDGGGRTDPKQDFVLSFNWATARWDLWSWRIIRFARTITKYPGIKSTTYFKVKFSNNLIDNNLTIIDLSVLWLPLKKSR
jgi:hypothetical protein